KKKNEPEKPSNQNIRIITPEFQYAMNYQKLGKCIIINNKNFDARTERLEFCVKNNWLFLGVGQEASRRILNNR
ncbi:hypothetical protein AB205_0168400, partial [Aquarana catesbeiana]